MDAFIASEAGQSLAALSALSAGNKLFGVLVGHKRGRRFVVEKAFPAAAFRFSPAEFARVDDLFAGKVLGFYASGDIARIKAKLRQPYAAGRLLVAVRTAKRAPSYKAYTVDFDGRFRVAPIPLIVEEGAP